jgi:hypothetical protein
VFFVCVCNLDELRVFSCCFHVLFSFLLAVFGLLMVQ